MPASDADPPVDAVERLLAIGLAAGRIAIGAGLWIAPQRAARALGFAGVDAPGLALARIAATRDVVLGVGQATALGDRPRLARATVAAAAADAGDAVAFALALADGETRSAGARGLPVATAAVAAGAWLARRLASRRGARS